MNPHRAEKTISVLLRAFMRGELIHNEACSCAVGNMLNGEGDWVFMIGANPLRKEYMTEWMQHGMAIIEASPYSLREIERIEFVFEGRNPAHIRTLGWDNDRDSYKGLCAVFDLLCDDIDREYFEARSPIVIRENHCEAIA